ncbi:unnamed protein product [Soboliphyme baturini]|uniref:ZP domain-containing protein n=1 Tax=Soboliphyme baturini TaxID=241478 RepID=A0A183ICH7_9BILA|nr:unnamed protein product [Soboliphyme baturini]
MFYVSGSPKIECGPIHIGITVKTKRPLGGSIYIRGRHHTEGCYNRSMANGMSANLMIPLADASNCGIETKRNLKNGEIVMSGVWIIASHPTFVTKSDEAYAVSCVFRQRDIMVNSEMDVSDLITEVMGRTAQMPSVAMKIVEGRSPDVSLATLRQAEVGQPMTILWYIPQGGSSIFGIRVRHCTVESREGSRVPILENGCSVQPSIIDDVKYQDDFAEAYSTASAFKFADERDLTFKCTVMVCTKVIKGDNRAEDVCSTQQVCLSVSKLNYSAAKVLYVIA